MKFGTAVPTAKETRKPGAVRDQREASFSKVLPAVTDSIQDSYAFSLSLWVPCSRPSLRSNDSQRR